MIFTLPVVSADGGGKRSTEAQAPAQPLAQAIGDLASVYMLDGCVAIIGLAKVRWSGEFVEATKSTITGP